MTQGAASPILTVSMHRFDKAHEEDVDKAHHEGGALGELPLPGMTHTGQHCTEYFISNRFHKFCERHTVVIWLCL